MKKRKKLALFTKLIFVIFIALIPTISLQACNFITNGDFNMKDNMIKDELIPIGPTKDMTLEDYITNAELLLAAVTDSYQKMTDSMENETATKKGIKAAKRVIKKYQTRIENLNKENFSTWSEDDLIDLSSELSDIITTIREARDLLGT